MAQDGNADIVECGERMEEEKDGTFTLRHAMKDVTKFATLCGRTIIGCCHTRRRTLEQMMRELIEVAERLGAGAQTSEFVVAKHQC